MISIDRPAPAEYADFYRSYVDQVPDEPILEVLARQGESTAALLATLDEKRAMHRYAEGKWSVKEIVGHLADAERVFAYRALVTARGDRTPQPGFDENAWVEVADFDALPIERMAGMLATVRGATLSLFDSFSAAELERQGIANGTEISVRALAWIIAGHQQHHVRVLAERYGVLQEAVAARQDDELAAS